MRVKPCQFHIPSNVCNDFSSNPNLVSQVDPVCASTDPLSHGSFSNPLFQCKVDETAEHTCCLNIWKPHTHACWVFYSVFASQRYNSASIPASLSDRHWGWRGRPSAGIMKGGKHEVSLQLYELHINKWTHKGTPRAVLCGRRTRLVVRSGFLSPTMSRESNPHTLDNYLSTQQRDECVF